MVTLKDFFSFKNNRFFWLNLIGMVLAVIVLAIGALWGLDQYTHHGESYVVPDVKNKRVDEAQALFARQFMQGVVIDSIYVKGMADGMVLDQTPAGGMRVKKGRTVYLTINTTEVPQVKIPDIIDNSSVRQAAAKLKAMGFKLTEPELMAGEQDWVYGIKFRGKSLRAGDKVPSESLLTLCIGNTHMRDSLSIDSLNMQLEEMPSGDDAPKVDESWF